LCHRLVLALLIGGLVAPSRVPSQERARRIVSVHGIAFDSIRKAPLRAAFVIIDGIDRTTTTDDHGRFTIDSVEPGAYTFVLQHPVFDSLGLSGITRKVAVAENGDDVTLAVPSFETLWRGAACQGRAPSDSGLVHGVVRDARTGEFVAGATVELSWIDLIVDKKRHVQQKRLTLETSSDAMGGYDVCGVPLTAQLRVQASRGARESGGIDLVPRDLRVQRLDLSITDPTTADSSSRGTIAGVIIDYVGTPVGGARVRLDEFPEVRTATDGRFVIRNAPAGTRQVEILTLGMAPIMRTVEVPPHDTAYLDVQLQKAVQLTGMTVTSTRARHFIAGYEERKKAGFARTMDSTKIEVYDRMGDVLQELPLATVRWNHGEAYLLIPDGRGGLCAPDVRIDGAPATITALTAIAPNRVAAMELYPRSEIVPLEFQSGGIRYRCGLLLVWTKWAFKGS